MFRTKFILFLVSLGILFSQVASAECSAERVVVLVPGTLNSAVPGAPSQNPFEQVYFSRAIRNAVSKHVCHSFVVNGLSWFGDFHENGRIVFDEIQTWQHQNPSLRGLPIDVIAHSAGGFYTLAAITRNEAKGRPLRFSKLHFLSTPMNGLELANLLTRNPFVRKQLEALVNRQYLGFDLRGLWQLRTAVLKDFYPSLSIPAEIEIHTYAGTQFAPAQPIDQFKAPFLPPVFQALDFLIDRPSDGVVSQGSALAAPFLLTTQGKVFENLIHHPEALVPLDHVEQVWDSNYLKHLGFEQTEWIDQQQILFIEQALQR
jgi:hypothetical protein